VLRGIAKYLQQWEQEAQASGAPAVFDHAFLAEHSHGLDAYLAEVEATPWALIEQQSGLDRETIRHAATIYRNAERAIVCWAMGITQHHHSVATIQEIANLLLLRGNLGKPGAGACPVRGHSNVQGDRTMGINERPPLALLDALQRQFDLPMPRQPGYNTVECIQAMLAGQVKVFIGLGGNFAKATPDTPRTQQALRNCALTVQISTKLNRSHLTMGRDALILPCLGRTDIDRQACGPQAVTVEDSFSMIHASRGQLEPASAEMRSEPAIVAGIAAATLGKCPVDWLWLVEDYARIRELIAATIPGFAGFDHRLHRPGGFYLGNAAARREWNTASGRAEFKAHPLPADLLPEQARHDGVDADLILQTLRSHDQYNTTLYGLDDRYRGVKGMRDVVFVNPADIQRLGLEAGQQVDLLSLWDDGIERRVRGFTLLAYDTPLGQAAAYYPETNPLVPLESFGERSHTPTSKFIAIRVLPNTQKTEQPLIASGQ